MFIYNRQGNEECFHAFNKRVRTEVYGGFTSNKELHIHTQKIITGDLVQLWFLKGYKEGHLEKEERRGREVGRERERER